MKKILFILLFPVVCFSQTKMPGCYIYKDNFKASYLIGDTLSVWFEPSGAWADGDSIIIQYYGPKDQLIVVGRTTFEDCKIPVDSFAKDSDRSYGFLFKYIISIPGIMRYMHIGANQTPYFDVSARVTAVLNPAENKDQEFDFYSQQGVFIRRCKISELNPGFYIANGFKICTQK